MLLIFSFERKLLQQADQPPSGFSSWEDQDIPLKDGTGEGEGLPASLKAKLSPSVG